MAEMGVALAAQSFYALHEQAAIFFGTNVLLGRGGPEAGPTRARLELLQRPEQGIATTDARVQSSRMVIPVAPGERAFRAAFARHGEFFRRKLVPPFGVGFRDRSEEHTSELQSLRHLVC